jgi:hypothetical protein
LSAGIVDNSKDNNQDENNDGEEDNDKEDNDEDYGSVRLVNEDEEKEANTRVVNGQAEMKLIITLRRRTRLIMTKMNVR